MSPNKLAHFDPGNPFQPSLIFAGKAWSLPERGQVVPSLIHKYKTKLERVAEAKCSSFMASSSVTKKNV
jgi:hypothetical protein